MSAVKVGIIGASGYTGLELVKILINHPIFTITYVANTEGGMRLSELHPSLSGVFDCDVQKADVNGCASACDLVFLAVPHQTAMAFVKPLISLGIKVVDLSADYRLPQDIYEAFYCPHTDEENLSQAVYGLPELFRDELKTTSLVANPGCFPTSAILAVLPFLKYRVEGTPVIVDSKTGVSGAGKKLSDTTHFVNVNDNLFAYNPLMHRHAPEIAQKLDIPFEEVHFVPHLVPLTRGMLSSVYLHVRGDFDPLAVVQEYYADEPFVRISKVPVDMKNVAGTNFCDLYVKRKGDMLFISSAIDNLMRGASSAAVVNANLMMGLDEALGIPKIAYVP
ncbi:MAG: N-acetyl-gamma-glutamyl-phosphate reductase [Thiovulaceae bacterium]|nr:N-acetyl-gamma-glutamyl-phosphate reductase [Sulfurimonadaceae bacterium]MDD3817488.1 N-acetyl-gamma-glutamyl-phosphate reductase [Sulfurimonadaceae bacterium]